MLVEKHASSDVVIRPSNDPSLGRMLMESRTESHPHPECPSKRMPHGFVLPLFRFIPSYVSIRFPISIRTPPLFVSRQKGSWKGVVSGFLPLSFPFFFRDVHHEVHCTSHSFHFPSRACPFAMFMTRCARRSGWRNPTRRRRKKEADGREPATHVRCAGASTIVA